MNFSLAPSATEFVPGKYAGSTPRESASISSNSAPIDSELKVTASEWVPSWAPSATSPASSAVSPPNPNGLTNMNDMGQALPSAKAGIEEPMVQVMWNGTSIFVPQSSTYIAEDGSVMYMGSEENVEGTYEQGGDGLKDSSNLLAGGGTLAVEPDGLNWAHGSYTLPAPPKRSLQTIGIPEPIRSHFRSLDLEALRQMDPDSERYKELPMHYHSAYPLYNPLSAMGMAGSEGSGGSCFGYPTSLFKVTDQVDSQLYALRRFDNVRTSPSVVANVMSRWQEIRHPGIVSLYGITLEKGAVFFSYAYHAGAQTLKQRYIDQAGPLLGESLLWRLLIQMLSAMRLVHGRGLAVRVVEPAHVILTSGTCARLSSVAVLDILEFESRKSMADLQQDDLVKLARLMLSLVNRALVNSKNTEDAIVLLKQHYSIDFQRVIGALLSGKLTVTQICNNPTVADRIHDELDTSMAATDALHSHLRNEYENGRLLRLLMKLGFINERPGDEWSETGDQYLLKLFRDHVFHQVTGEGLPILDAGHVITALNKLDAGDPEDILMSSRDGKDLLVVSYTDVQR
jgi:PAB-dependent poly(A)-specific ribonuclease subunit 3